MVDQLFSTPRRQSGKAIVIILIRYLRLIVRQIWPVILIFLLNPKRHRAQIASFSIVGIVFLAFIYSILDYLLFRFYVENDELVVKSGVFRRKTLNIPFDRIQSVDFKRNVVHQFLQVVSVKIDTAGTSAKELEFDAMEIREAEAFRDLIMKGRSVATESKGIGVSETALETSTEVPPVPPQVILKLSWKDLVKVGVSANHLRTAAIIIAFFLTIVDDLNQYIGLNLFQQLDQSSLFIKLITFLVAILSIPFFILVSFLVSLLGSVIRYFNLTFWFTEGKFKVVSGLFTRNEKTIQLHKIQLFTWRTSPIQEVFGMFRLNIYQTTSAEDNQATSLEIPGSYQAQIDRTMEFVYPGITSAIFKSHRIDPGYVQRMVFMFGLLPALAIGFYAYYNDGVFLWLLTGIFPLSVWMGYLYQSKRRVNFHPEYIISEAGIFGKTRKLIELYKIQHISLTSSPRERRRDVRTLYLYTAGGQIMIPYLNRKVAEDAMNYILYKIESSEKNWM